MRNFGQMGATVTPLFRQERVMQDPVILDLLSYWERLRAGRIAPMRSELDPREIRGALDHTFVLELTRYGTVRFRLAGIKICDLMGMELRGMPAHSVVDLDERKVFDAVLADLLADPKIVELQLVNRQARPNLGTARMLLLPMRSETGKISRILGCVSVHGGRSDPPQRFAITERKDTRIVSSQKVKPEQIATGFAEPQEDFTPRPAKPKPVENPHFQSVQGGNSLNPEKMRKTRPHLRLVKDE